MSRVAMTVFARARGRRQNDRLRRIRACYRRGLPKSGGKVIHSCLLEFLEHEPHLRRIPGALMVKLRR